MKVLKKGEGWSISKTCKGCKAVLQADASDIQYEITDSDLAAQQYNDDIEGTFFILCPECGQYIKFKDKELPETIKAKLK